jgi:hypothetical protein
VLGKRELLHHSEEVVDNPAGFVEFICRNLIDEQNVGILVLKC